MTLHILVEGASELAFFYGWTKRLRTAQNIRVHAHQGKGSLPGVNARANPKLRGLLDQLPFKLKAFESTLSPYSDGVLILVDADDDSPEDLCREILSAIHRYSPSIRVKVSIATEETEAFYLGDLNALQRAYPNAKMNLARAYIPDSICGTWEIFGQIIGDDGGNKVAWAEKMGNRLTTVASKSRSPSFKTMLGNIKNLEPIPSPAPTKKRFHHRKMT